MASLVFPENRTSLDLMGRMGFKEIAVLEKHGRLEGAWKDTAIIERLIQENID